MLLEACQTIGELDPENFDNEEAAIELTTTIDAMFAMLDDGLYLEALAVLDNDVLQRIDGCANTGEADEDDCGEFRGHHTYFRAFFGYSPIKFK